MSSRFFARRSVWFFGRSRKRHSRSRREADDPVLRVDPEAIEEVDPEAIEANDPEAIEADDPVEATGGKAATVNGRLRKKEDNGDRRKEKINRAATKANKTAKVKAIRKATKAANSKAKVKGFRKGTKETVLNGATVAVKETDLARSLEST